MPPPMTPAPMTAVRLKRGARAPLGPLPSFLASSESWKIPTRFFATGPTTSGATTL